MATDLVMTNDRQLSTIGAGRMDTNAAAVYLARLAPSSRDTMRRALGIVARMLTGDEAADYLAVPWPALRFQHVAAIRAELAQRYSHATANRILAAVRGVLRAARNLGQMTADDYSGAAAVERVRGETVPAGRAVASGELAALMGACGADRGGIRDAAIIALMYAGGLRRAEIVALDLADWTADDGGGRLLIHGKGNKQRVTPIVNGAARLLADWLAVRGDDAGPLFQVVGHRNHGGRMTTQAVYAMLRARATAAGVATLSPHDLRRTFVGDLLDAGADIVTVQKLAGHASPTTTARYDRRGEAVKRAAVDRLHVPYTRRVLA